MPLKAVSGTDPPLVPRTPKSAPKDGNMDGADFEILLDLLERKIHRSSPTTAEYWRGYCQGIKEYFHHKTEESAYGHHHLNTGKDHGRPNLESYARGYCDGLKGSMNWAS